MISSYKIFFNILKMLCQSVPFELLKKNLKLRLVIKHFGGNAYTITPIEK